MAQDATELNLALAGWPISGIVDWVRDDMAKICLAATLSGGWEVWAQVEIALKLRLRYPTLDREQKIFQFGTKDSCDIWIPVAPTFLNPNPINIAIELKVRLKQEVGSAFHTRLGSDFQKIATNGGPKTALRPAITYAVGITDNSGDMKAFADSVLLPKGGTVSLYELYYLKVTGKDASNNDLTLYVVWWQKKWT